MNYILKGFLFRENIPLKTFGKSMFPLLYDKAIVFSKKTRFGSLKNNDIIIVKKGGVVFTHRVVYKTKKYLITKGDNNINSDKKITPNQVVGQIYQVKRNNRVFDPETLYLVQSTSYFQEIVRIKNTLKKNKIGFVFLKGLPLHLYFEKTHPRRIYLDCDVLIDKKQFIKAEKILLYYGYKKRDVSLSLTQKKIKDKETEAAYYKIVNGFSVTFDLHLEPAFMMTQLGRLEALYPQKLIDHLTKDFLKNKQVVNIENESYLILNTQYLILYLALHFFHHNFRGAFRLEFLDKVIRHTCHAELVSASKPKILKQVQDDIVKYRLGNFVYPVFILLKKYYQTPIPKEFLKKIQPVNPLTRQLVNRLAKVDIFNDEPRIQAGITRFKNLFLLSPRPLWIKMSVFTNPQVVYSLLLVLQKRFARFFSFLNPKKAI